jgi:hypothetical protein
MQQATKKPEPDLLATLAANRWRLDCRHEVPEWRVLYWCVECKMWRSVVPSGDHYPSPQEAIIAAIKALNAQAG